MDPATITTIVTEVLKYGTAGLIILVLMVVIWQLWVDNKSHITARLADQAAFQSKLSDLVSNSITATKDLSNMIELLKEKIRPDRCTSRYRHINSLQGRSAFWISRLLLGSLAVALSGCDGLFFVSGSFGSAPLEQAHHVANGACDPVYRFPQRHQYGSGDTEHDA